MATKVLGIEFGSDTMKLAVCSGGIVKSMVTARLPENMIREGRATSPAALSEFIKGILKENGIRGGNCAMVLPPQLMIAHKVTMPAMSEAELMLNLPFEFRDFVGKEGSKFEYDYSVISRKENSLELYTAAVRKETVEEYYDILRKAGLRLKAAMPPEMAWLNLIRRASNLPEKLCIVDIGCNATRVNIFSNGSFEMGKEIEMGGLTLDRAIADTRRLDPFSARAKKEANTDNVLSDDVCADVYSSLAVEVMKIISFYRFSTEDGNRLQDMYWCGGGSSIEALRVAIMKSSELTMHHIRRLIPSETVDDDLLQCAALAAGAGIQLQPGGGRNG